MTEGLQRVASWQTAGFSAGIFFGFTRNYWHLFQTMLLNSLQLRILTYMSNEVRHCGTALPHNRTALLDESFVVARGARNMVPRPEATAAQAGVSGVAAQRGGQPAGAAGTGCRIAPDQCANRVVSQKLVAYFSVSIPSCPERSGARSVGEGTRSVRVVPGARQGSGRLICCQSIDFRAAVYPGLWLFMPIYFILSY